MKTNPRPIRLAIKEALKCTTHRHRLGAVVIRGSNVLSVACNRSGVHAEVRALQRLWPSEREGTVIWVVRIPRASGRTVGMSRPCEHCRTYLRESKVKKVFFTNDDGTIGEWRP